MDVDAAVPEERVAVVSSDSSGDEGSGSSWNLVTNLSL